MHTQRTSFAMAYHRNTAGAVFIMLLLWIFTALPSILTAQTNGMAATSVLGQANFTSGTSNRGGTLTSATLNNPRDMVIDATTGKLFIIDFSNNRVLRYTSAQAQQSGGSAEAVFGQLNLTSGNANQGGTTTATTLDRPAGLAIDGSGNLYIADRSNNRVLRYANAATAASGTTATAVFGQPNMTSGTANQGGATTASTLREPVGLAIDGSGNLYVADGGLSGGNNRVLRYANAATATNGTEATVVFGQPNMTSGFANQGGAISASTLSAPFGLAIDGSGNLYVADGSNNRVLRYANAATATNGASASAVFGQPGMTSGTGNNGGISASTLSGPYSLSLDTFGNLYVADTGNHRVLRYANAATATTSNPGPVATVVLGQSDFTSGGNGLTASSLNSPRGVVTDASQNLYVADASNNRVLRFLLITTATATPTTVSFGTNFVGGATTTQSVIVSYAGVIGNENFTYVLGGNTAGYTLTPTTLSTSGGTSAFNHTLTLSLNPTVATTQNAVLWVNRVLSGTTLATIPLSGNVFAVTTMTVSPSSLNFGTVTQFDNGSTQTLTLTFNNIRAGERVTYSLTNDGGGAYTIENTNPGFTTTASQTVFTTTVTIRLNSNFTIGAKTGVLRISTNSSTTPTDIALSGTIAGINVSFTPTSLDFGNVTLGAGFATTATRTVTMTWSNARVPTTVTMTTTGSMFSREANFELTTATGTRTITVTYNPIALGTHTGTLTITGGNPPALVMSRAKDSEDEIAAPANNSFTQDISLSGRAVPPPPPAPTISISSIVSAGFVVGWNVPTSAESYTIDIATDANFTSLVVNNASVNTTSYTTNGLTGNTTYWVRVRAVNGQGASANSNVVSALTIPGTTTVLSTTNIGASSATLNWTAPSGGAASYTVDLSINNTFTSFVSGWNGQTTSSASVSGVSVNASGLTQGTAYFWRVRGVNTTGTSANSAVQSFTTLLVPTLVSFTPNPIGQGQTLTLTGTNFATPMTVQIGSVNVTATVVSSVQATVVIPSTVVGVQSVGVTTPGGSASTTQTLTIIAPPTISNVTWVITSNATGGVGNTIFTITGTNFISPSVQISQFQSDGVESGLATITGNILSSSLTQIVVSVPPSMLSVIGQYGMVVGNLAGTARFAVNYVPPPEIVSLTPNTLGASAITNARQPIVITIEGNNVVDVNGVVGGRVFSVPEFRLSTVNGGVGTGRSVREFVVNPFDITRTTRVYRLSLPLELLQAVGTYTLTLTTAGGSTSQTIRVFQDRFTVSGTLRRTDIVGTTATANQDMSGITVVWSGSEGVRSVTTNTAGSYSFAQVLPGTYTIEYRSERFRITPVSSTVMVRSDTVLSNPQEVRLRQYMMSGRVTVNSGSGFTGVNQAEVNILGVGGDAGNPVVSRRLASDADGRFAGINLPSGSYQVRVSSTIGTFDMVSAQIIDRDIVIDEVLLRGRAISRATATSASVAVQGSANIGAVTEEFRNVPATAANTTVIVTRTPDFGDLVVTSTPTVNIVAERAPGYEPVITEARAVWSKEGGDIQQVRQERILRLGDTVALADVQNGRVVYRPRVQQTQTDTIRFNLAFTVGVTNVNSVVTVRFNVAQRPPRITAIPSPAEITVRANERPGIQWFIADDRGSFDYAGVDSIRVTRVVSSNETLLRASSVVFGQFDRGRWHMTMPLERNTTGTTVITATFTLNFNGFTETSTQSMRVNVLPATSIRPVTEVIQSLQPNPARDMVQIVWQGKRTESARLTIVNLLGQAVQTLTVERGVEQTQIDVSRLSAGTYRVMIEDSRGMTAQALVVVR